MFWAPCGSGEGQVGGGYLWAWWCPYMHAHTHMYTCKKLQMAVNIEASMFIMFNMHVCVCVHVYNT